MEFLLIHYKALIAVIGSLTGLLGIGLTFYSKSQDSKLKLLEMELKKEQFKEDKKHQITKEKYQELFAKKIEVYTTLQKEIYKYYDNILNIGREIFNMDEWGRDTRTEITSKDVAIDLLNSIDKQFKENLFLISNDLEKQYKTINLAYSKSNKYIDEFFDFVGDPDESEKEHNKVMSKFYKEHKDNINNLVTLIEEEIKVMKLNIGFDS